jgi:hypothetical protein
MQLHSPTNTVPTLPGFTSYLRVVRSIEPITLRGEKAIRASLAWQKAADEAVTTTARQHFEANFREPPGLQMA